MRLIMRVRILFAAVLCLGLSASSTAHAFSFSELECDALKLTGVYWVAYGVVEQAQETGLIANKTDCQQLSDTINDFQVPDQTVMDCICTDLFGSGTTLPACRIAHNVCTEGSPLPNNIMSQTNCTPTASQQVAADVCQFD